MSQFNTPFKNAVVPMPTPAGNWGGTLGASIPDAPKTTPDELHGHDSITVDGQGPGKIADSHKSISGPMGSK
ncbi:MAG: hypothetical protein V1790_00870 [Planctomycetota bacterium]